MALNDEALTAYEWARPRRNTQSRRASRRKSMLAFGGWLHYCAFVASAVPAEIH